MKVILIHGLARTSLSLVGLEQRLNQVGWETEHFGYFAFAEAFDAIAARLGQRLQALAQQEPYTVVAHSLGGLLTRAALTQVRGPGPAHVVMLGTPNQRPRLALHAWQVLPFRWFTGQCGFNLTCADFFERLPRLQSPYTIVAGTAGPRGAWSPFGHEINDGIVALGETQLAAGDAILQLPVWHTFMMNDPGVQASVLQALASKSVRLAAQSQVP